MAERYNRVSRFPFAICRHLCLAFLVSRFPFPISRFPFAIRHHFVPRVSRFTFSVFHFPFSVCRSPSRVFHFSFCLRFFSSSSFLFIGVKWKERQHGQRIYRRMYATQVTFLVSEGMAGLESVTCFLVSEGVPGLP